MKKVYEMYIHVRYLILIEEYRLVTQYISSYFVLYVYIRKCTVAASVKYDLVKCQNAEITEFRKKMPMTSSKIQQHLSKNVC